MLYTYFVGTASWSNKYFFAATVSFYDICTIFSYRAGDSQAYHEQFGPAYAVTNEMHILTLIL